MTSIQPTHEVTPADLHNYDALGHESCNHHFTHDGTDDRWLLDHNTVPAAPSTEKHLNIVNQVTIRANKVDVGQDTIYRPEVMKTIEAEIDRLNPLLRKISMDIHGMLLLRC